MRNIGFNSTDDPVYPDLAFSLPLSKIPGDSQINRKKSVVSVGVKDYQGQYGPQPLKHLDDADKIYRRFIEEVADFVIWLLEHTYTVRLIIGDVIYDAQAREDIRKSINRRNIQYKNNQLIDEPIESNKQLISQMVTSDIVVSPRFHNVLLGLLLNKPVIALSYHEKFLTLMGCPGLAEYNLHIDHFNANTLIEKFIKLESNSDELKQQISRMTAENRRLLDEQYNVITNIYHD
jgi:polysaccharide pyruvyl transferase WcaK-like protein